ncbi:hypothetical protein RJ55_07561 [Drechmeria coniospora]|nr:hypothetical protein RJ55_07561 [Drechmeria coniospora]
MLRSLTLVTLVGASSVLATKCSLGSKCPEDTPCCSQYGECGVGAFCLGGCDPRSSFSLDSCTPQPVCKDTTTKFTSLDSIVDISKYLGDPSQADWVAQGEPAKLGDSVLLTMPKNSVGTVLASTTYMWYGNVKAKFKTSRGRGVVTAFILLSDVKDEIDYEFVGVDLNTAQTNYYFQGIPDYHNSGNISMSDTFNNYHEYEIRWTPDRIDWLVDGQVGRSKERKDTWNATSQQWMFPQTPARVQLSLWPGGLASNAKGTVDWAGGEIDWNSEDIQTAGYYYAQFAEVTMECYTAKSGPGSNNGVSYTMSNSAGTNDTIVVGSKKTVLGSLLASGLDMDKGKLSPSASSSARKSKVTQATIPGGSVNSAGNDHSGSGSGASSSGSSGSSGSSDSGDSTDSSDGGDSSSGSTSACASNSFSQDCGGKTVDGSGGKSGSGKASTSALAMIIAGAALFWL